MLEAQKNEMLIAPDTNAWRALHRDCPCGIPAEILFGDRPIIKDCHFYIDDLSGRQVILSKRRYYCKAGAGVVEEDGYFPFGNQVGFRQFSRYAANCLRITFDLHWPVQTPVERHLGIGGMFLPGQWTGYFCIPPARHLCEGASAYTVSLSEADFINGRMVGHWHRPPLALVFHRADGTRVEIGTGSDIWRWQQSLGAGPESGSYKIIIEPDGIRLVREPLMTCTAFTPQARSYRFKWYLAWDRGRQEGPSRELIKGIEHQIDLSHETLPENAFRLLEKNSFSEPQRTCLPCWLSPVINREVKRRIRQLAAINEPGTLLVQHLLPGLCRDGSHLQRGRQGMLTHWDMDAILDITGWMRRQLGSKWRIFHSTEHPWQRQLPSFSSLFAEGGFQVY